MEVAILKNTVIAQFYQDIVQLFFTKSKISSLPGASLIRRQIAEIQDEVIKNPKY